MAWAEERGIRLIYIQPGKPVQNSFIESFNGRFRDECLNANWFENMTDARRKIDDGDGAGTTLAELAEPLGVELRHRGRQVLEEPLERH